MTDGCCAFHPPAGTLSRTTTQFSPRAARTSSSSSSCTPRAAHPGDLAPDARRVWPPAAVRMSLHRIAVTEDRGQHPASLMLLVSPCCRGEVAVAGVQAAAAGLGQVSWWRHDLGTSGPQLKVTSPVSSAGQLGDSRWSIARCPLPPCPDGTRAMW